MPRKKIFYIVIILLIIFVGFFIYYEYQKNKIEISINNKKFLVNNFYGKNNKKLSYNGIEFQNTPDYTIDYYPEDGFLISINNPDIQTAREKAEQYFLKALGINKNEACQLKISLGVPFYVNKNASGLNYGLSFCPNGIPFPSNE